MTYAMTFQELDSWRHYLLEEIFPQDKERIRVCTGTACLASGARQVIEDIEEDVKQKGCNVEVTKTGCQGLCQKGPLVQIDPKGYFYQRVKGSDAPALVANALSAGPPIRHLLYTDPDSGERCERLSSIPFYKKQRRIVLRNNGRIDPTNIRHYIALGGYAAIQKALRSMTPDEVLREVEKAYLRGRGGAGFPAGTKWRHTKKAPGDVKFVIANGDEGDPGAFMDRAIMEGDPHSLIEGMLLCAYAIGASYGFIYVRHEYPRAVKNLKIAVNQAQELGLLGDNILGTGFLLHLDIREGAGAFICGESTALVAYI